MVKNQAKIGGSGNQHLVDSSRTTIIIREVAEARISAGS